MGFNTGVGFAGGGGSGGGGTVGTLQQVTTLGNTTNRVMYSLDGSGNTVAGIGNDIALIGVGLAGAASASSVGSVANGFYTKNDGTESALFYFQNPDVLKIIADNLSAGRVQILQNRDGYFALQTDNFGEDFAIPYYNPSTGALDNSENFYYDTDNNVFAVSFGTAAGVAIIVNRSRIGDFLSAGNKYFFEVDNDNSLFNYYNNGGFKLKVDTSGLTADRARVEPNKDGTYAMLTDVTAAVAANVGVVNTLSIQDSGTGITAQTYTLDLSANAPYTINTLKIKSGSGTCTAAVQINGVNVTSLSAISVSTTISITNATGTNTVVNGDLVTLVITSPSSLNNLQVGVKVTTT